MTLPCMAPITTPQRFRSGLHRFRPARDLPALADLIEVAYEEELALTGSSLVERLRQLAAMAPLIGVVDRIAPLLDGYVWIEDGELVGNVTLNRDSRILGAWTMSNVAVLPDFRGRGIAGRLVDAALAHLDDLGARCALLQVRADNAPAVALYRHRGFAVYETIQEWRLSRRRLRPLVHEPEPRVRPLRHGDAKRLLELARQSQPSLMRSLRPVRRSDLGLALWQQAGRLATRALRIPQLPTVVVAGSSELDAYARLSDGEGASLQLETAFAAEEAQQWAPPLLAALLVAPRARSWSHILAEIPAHLTQVQATLQEMGFEPLRTLHGMVWEPPRSQQHAKRE